MTLKLTDSWITPQLFLDGKRGNLVSKVTTTNGDICAGNSEPKLLITVATRVDYPTAKNFCRKIGGRMIEPKTIASMEDALKRSSTTLGNTSCSRGYWSRIVQSKEALQNETFEWILDPVNPLREGKVVKDIQWRPGQPNGLRYQQCLSINIDNGKVSDQTV